jgi:hydrogenase maturation factor
MIGKVIDVLEDSVVVEGDGERCSAKFYSMDIEHGDWVIIESGYVLAVVTEAEALAIRNGQDVDLGIDDEDAY